MKNCIIYKSKIGDLCITSDGNYITNINIIKNKNDIKCEIKETKILLNMKSQLDLYFNKKIKIFDIPIKLNGTKFQNEVWNVLLKIPYGKTLSYGEIAKFIGNSKSCRAVGMACNKNPIMIIVPCHRVIGKNKKLVGYAGGLDVKQKLLNLESDYDD